MLQRVLAAAFLSAFCAIHFSAQVPNWIGTVSVSGKLVDSVTGQGIPMARVTFNPALLALRNGEGVVTVNTDEQGNFVVERLVPGPYTIFAAKEGYRSGSAEGQPGGIIRIAANIRIGGMRLDPLGVISVKVVDQQGNPVRNAAVNVGDASRYGGAPIMQPISGARATDESGEFPFPYASKGDSYYFQAIPPPPRETRESGAEVPLPTYFPMAGTLSGAQPVKATFSGQEVRITLREGLTFHIKGKVEGTPPVPLSAMHLLLVPEDQPGEARLEHSLQSIETLSARVGGDVPIKPDGSFELSGVERGSYDLMAAQPKRRSAFGRVPVTVNGEDVTGVILPVGNLAQLSWTLRFEGQESGGTSCGIVLYPLEALGVLEAAFGNAGADGRAKIADVAPGKYTFSLQCREAGWFVKSARMRGEVASGDILGTALDVLAGENADIDVLMSKEAGSVAGTVLVDADNLGIVAKMALGYETRLRNGKTPVPLWNVTLIPQPPRWEQTPRLVQGAADEQGKFLLRNVAPGQYKLYAWPRGMSTYDLLNPDFLKRFDSQAVKVTVDQPGQLVQADAPAIQP